MAVDNQNGQYLVAVRANPDSGHLELVSFNKESPQPLDDPVTSAVLPLRSNKLFVISGLRPAHGEVRSLEHRRL